MNDKANRLVEDSPLDATALDRVMKQYKEAERQKALREWLVYKAPPGVYDAFQKERQAIVDDLRRRQQEAKILLLILAGVCVLFVLAQTVMP